MERGRLALVRADHVDRRREREVQVRRAAAELLALPGQHLRVAHHGPVVVRDALVLAHPARVDGVRTGALGRHVRQRALHEPPVVLGVLAHPAGRAGVADDHADRAEQRDVDRPDRADRRHGVRHPRVEDRDEPGAAVAGGVAVPVELDEHDVGLVQADLGVLVLVVRDLDRDGGVLQGRRVLDQGAGQRPARAGVGGGRARRRGGRGGRRGRRRSRGLVARARGDHGRPGGPERAQQQGAAVQRIAHVYSFSFR